MIILALIGMCGAGKSAAAHYLKQKSFEGVYFGSLTLAEIERRGLEPNEENEKKMRKTLREKHGMGAFAKLSINKIKKMAESVDKIYIDGLYSWEEYLILSEEFKSSIKLIQIYAEKKTRYHRLANRKHRPLFLEEAQQRDINEIEHLQKGGPIAFCDHLVDNNKRLAVLHQQLDSIVDKYS